MAIYQLGNLTPAIHESVYIAQSATIIGNVRIGECASVWPQAVIRGDSDVIDTGAGTNIQDGCVLHADEGSPLRLSDNVTVGHQAMLHGCTVGEGTLIGIQAVVLNGAVIGKKCLVGAGSVVTQGKVFPDYSLIMGAPAQVVRKIDSDLERMLLESAQHYVELGEIYRFHLTLVS